MSSLPPTYKRIVCHKLSSNFREATRIETLPLNPRALLDDEVLVRNHFVGVNASDVNYTAGRYSPGVKPPFAAGFESLGVVVAKGKSAKLNVGQAVAISAYDCFSEYQFISAKKVVPVPAVDAKYLPLLVSGITASLALEQVGNMKSGETVLVTAAAGGTGIFAVQLAKLAGNHVIGTCSSDEKVQFLKSLGCDRVINYKKEDLHTTLKREYPNGVDLVYESVGGKTFDICVNNLAVCGRLIIIGFMSGYADQTGWKTSATEGATITPLPAKLIGKSASVRGFFMPNFMSHYRRHMQQLFSLVEQGKLKSVVDEGNFQGLEDVPNAIDYMYAGKNKGKVVVRLPHAQQKQLQPQQQQEQQKLASKL